MEQEAATTAMERNIDAELQDDVPVTQRHITDQSASVPHSEGSDCIKITPESLTLVDLSQQQIDRIVHTVPGGAKNIQDIYPLSPLQEGMLFHHLLNMQGDTYVLSALLQMKRRDQLDTVVNAVQRTIERHDILRSAVIWEEMPRPVQVVYRQATLPVEEFALDPEKELDTQIKEHMKPTWGRFDIRKGPLLRLLVSSDPHTQIWYAVLKVHHLVCDHRSLIAVMSEVMMHISYREHELPAPASFRNQVVQALRGAETQEAEKFFRSKLGDVDEPTAPFGLLDVHGIAGRISEASKILERDLALRVRACARELGISAARLFHAAWGLVAAHTSRRDDVVYGTVLLAGRQRDLQSQYVLGMSVNTLPLRLRMRNATVRELVEHTHRELRELLNYEQASLTLAQSCSLIPSTIPLFTSLLNYRHSASGLGVDMTSETGVQVLARGEAWSNYPVSMIVDDMGEDFLLTAQTAPKVEPHRVIEYLQTAVRSLVEALEHAPYTKALELSILPESERRQVIQSFQPASARRHEEKLIHQLFEEQVCRSPEAVAVTSEGESLTYNELNERSNRLARYLRTKGVEPNHIVGVCVERSTSLVISLLAVQKAGGAYLPLDPNYPTERLTFMVADARPAALLIQESLRELLPATSAEIVSLDGDCKQIAQQPIGNLDPGCLRTRPRQLAYVIYTSGSTGRPKGVMVEHSNVTRLFASTNRWFGFNEKDVWTLFHSFAFDFSVWELWGALLYGGRIVVVSHHIARSPQDLYRLLCKERVTVLNQTPSAFAHLIDAEIRSAEKQSSLRLVVFGGEALELRMLRPWVQRYGTERPRLVNMYGITETTVHVTYYPVRIEDIEAGRRDVMGEPIADLRVYLLDRRRQPVPIGVPGEIYVGGRGVARGYLNRPALTAERFVADPFSEDAGARLYRTGDLAQWSAQGTLEYMGRNDDQVKIRGFRIELGEIEAQLVSHDKVREAVIVPLGELATERKLVAYVVPADPRTTQPGPTMEDLRTHLRMALPEYMVPSAFVLLERLPLTSNGKLDRRALPKPTLESYVSHRFEEPLGEVERVLADIWRELLRVERVGRGDSFFELGGHSLLAMQLLSRIQSAFDIEMPMRLLFKNPTVQQFSARVEEFRLAASTGHIYERTGRSSPGEQRPKNASIQAEIKARPRPEGAVTIRQPTSWSQERLWFLDQLEGAGAAYNIPVVMALRGMLDQKALQEALSTIVRRHEILRTRFATVDGEPRQEISQTGRFALEITDLRGRDSASREALIQLHKADEAKAPFDLSVGPLARGRLLRVDSDEHVLLVTMHHIISDGWSMGVFIRELTQLYAAYREKRGNPLDPLEIQYADYVQWQRNNLQGDALDRQLRYWRDQLDGAEAELNLPLDRPRPMVKTYRGGNIAVLLDSQLSSELNSLAKRHGMTLFMLLYAGWAVFLSRLSGQEDIVLGTPVANRRRAELENLIGFFVNTLVLRVQVRNDDFFGVLLERVKAVTLDAYEHQDIPFEQVVKEVRAERTLSRNPIFQVMFALQNAPPSDLNLPGLVVKVEDGGNETSKFDLLLSLEERGGHISGYLNYDSDLFDRETVQRWSSHFECLLRGMISGEHRRVRDLPLLSEVDRRQILKISEGAQRTCFDGGLVHELFEAQARRTPHVTAVVHDGQTLTYEELNRRANQLARYLRSRGIGRERLVGICLERSFNMVIGILGILKSGSAYVPLDPNYPFERVQYMLTDARLRSVLTQASVADLLGGAVEDVIAVDASWMEIIGNNDASPTLGEGGVRPESVYVIYTSGSTGRPKGTVMAHRSMVNLLEWHRENLGVRVGERVLQYAALSFDVAFQEIFSTLCGGGTLVLLDEWRRRDPQALAELLTAQSIERLFLPPLMLQTLAEYFAATCEWPRGLREVITAGEQLRISREIVQLFQHAEGCRLHNHYGPTEAHVVSALTLEGLPGDWPVLPAIGHPISNVQIYILDQQRELVPLGVKGEIYIAGASVARGYLRQPELTAERFLANPFSANPASRLYRTGDLGRCRTDGTIEYLGRNDDQVKIRGFRIELGEIEAQLLRNPQVKEASVLVRNDAPGGKRLVAYVTQRNQCDLNVDALRRYLKDLLPDYMVPSAFVILASMPHTPSGKLDKRALPIPDMVACANESYDAPQGEVEAGLARVWQELLQVERVGRQDDFFELGGHSLLVLKALSKTNQQFGSALTVTDLYRSPSIRDLAMRISVGQVDDDFVDLSQEAALENAIRAASGSHQAPAEAVLLTGGTGFVGRFLLAQLLQDTAATIYCLVRARSQYQAMSRLRGTMEKWDLWRDEFAPRIVAIAGDLRLPRLGLDEKIYRRLSQKIDSIYHCGTSMNHLETYAMAKPANVQSAKELLMLATEDRPKLINFISALGIFRGTPGEAGRVVDETSEIDQEKHPTSNGYVASKWVGEKIFMIAGERGIPCNIFRLGFVWADTQRGRYDELQRGYRILKSCMLSGFGIENYRHHSAPTPVDYVARAVVYLANRHPEGRGVFHISSSGGMIEGMFERCNEIAGTSLEILPFYEWVRQIKRLHHEGQSLPIVPLIDTAFSMDEKAFYAYLERIQNANVPFDCTRTYQELERVGIRAPELDDQLLRGCVDSMLTRDPECQQLRVMGRTDMTKRRVS